MHKSQADRGPAAGASSSLMQRLLARLRTRPRRRGEPMAPPGERSGEGTESIAPYLQQARSTRPGPLE